MFVNKYCLPNKMHCIIAPLNGVGGIYLGDIDAAQDPDLLERNSIKAIISVLDQSINIRGSIQKLWIMAEDSDDYPLHRYFDMSYKFIETQSQRTNILIHCYAGISRSTTLLAAYLMRKYGWNSQKSVSHIQSRRRVACPNQGFMRQLQDHELKIFPENRPISKSSSMHQIKPREYGSVRMVDNDRFTEFNRKLEDFRHQMKKKQRGLVC